MAIRVVFGDDGSHPVRMTHQMLPTTLGLQQGTDQSQAEYCQCYAGNDLDEDTEYPNIRLPDPRVFVYVVAVAHPVHCDIPDIL